MSKWEVQRKEELRENVKSLPGKKNTREWCKGKVGRYHDVEVRRDPVISDDTLCHRWPFGELVGHDWICYHQIHCVNCGKILNHSLGDDCPLWTAKPDVDAKTQ